MLTPVTLSSARTSAGGSPSAFGWKESATDALVAKARAERDSGEAKRLGAQAQRTRWEDGNQVLPVFKPNLNAQAKGATGIRDDLFEQFPGFSQASLAASSSVRTGHGYCVSRSTDAAKIASTADASSEPQGRRSRSTIRRLRSRPRPWCRPRSRG